MTPEEPKISKHQKRYRRLCRRLAQDFNGAALDVGKNEMCRTFKAIGLLLEKMALYG